MGRRPDIDLKVRTANGTRLRLRMSGRHVLAAAALIAAGLAGAGLATTNDVPSHGHPPSYVR